jgi:hypothetical protein
MVKIDGKIVGFELKQVEAPIVQTMHEGITRPEDIAGRTYKIKLPNEEHATYVTINDVVLNQGTRNEEIRPFEIFINSKNTLHRQWIDTLTRVISAVFRKGGEIGFLIEELKSITDPNGGGWYKGRYVKSLVSEIGYVIEKHITNKPTPVVAAPVTKVESNNDIPGATKCPSCGVKAVIKKDSCPTCLACGDSKCA